MPLQSSDLTRLRQLLEVLGPRRLQVSPSEVSSIESTRELGVRIESVALEQPVTVAEHLYSKEWAELFCLLANNAEVLLERNEGPDIRFIPEYVPTIQPDEEPPPEGEQH